MYNIHNNDLCSFKRINSFFGVFEERGSVCLFVAQLYPSSGDEDCDSKLKKLGFWNECKKPDLSNKADQ